MKIVVEPTGDGKFAVAIENEIDDIQAEVLDTTETVTLLAARLTSHNAPKDTEDFKVWRKAMDHLDAASESFDQLLQTETVDAAQSWNRSSPQEREVARALVEHDVDQQPVLRAAKGQAQQAYKAFHAFIGGRTTPGSISTSRVRAAVIGQLAAGVAGALYALGDDHDPEHLRELYDEAEPLITLLLGVGVQTPPKGITSKGGSA